MTKLNDRQGLVLQTMWMFWSQVLHVVDAENTDLCVFCHQSAGWYTHNRCKTDHVLHKSILCTYPDWGVTLHVMFVILALQGVSTQTMVLQNGLCKVIYHVLCHFLLLVEANIRAAFNEMGFCTYLLMVLGCNMLGSLCYNRTANKHGKLQPFPICDLYVYILNSFPSNEIRKYEHSFNFVFISM